MEVKYSANALNDIEFWKKNGNESELRKISSLIESIEKSPYHGIGKPERLKYELSGQWSRRINKKDRIIYEITDFIEILSLRDHYDDK
jgi:toxin YoeB